MLLGDVVCIGAIVNLKKLVISEFLFVFRPICFVLYVEWVLGWLQVVVGVVDVVVGVFAATGSTSWSMLPLLGMT